MKKSHMKNIFVPEFCNFSFHLFLDVSDTNRMTVCNALDIFIKGDTTAFLIDAFKRRFI